MVKKLLRIQKFTQLLLPDQLKADNNLTSYRKFQNLIKNC